MRVFGDGVYTKFSPIGAGMRGLKENPFGYGVGMILQPYSSGVTIYIPQYFWLDMDMLNVFA